jgi:hypothetical protein
MLVIGITLGTPVAVFVILKIANILGRMGSHL